MSPPFDDTKFIGKRYGSTSQLEVLSFEGYRVGNKNRYYKVKCHVCCEDPAMFGDATYVTAKSMIDKGIEPCGCSKSVRFTPEQNLTRAARFTEGKGYDVLGYAEDYKGVFTRIRVRCSTCQFCWSSTTITNFLLGIGCPSCAAKVTGDRYRKRDEDVVQSFLATGAFPKGTTFTRSLKGAGKKRCHWYVTCPICSKDEYVSAGLCTGVFQQNSGALLRGAKACRCSVHYTWTPDQRRFLIEQTIKDRNLRYNFVEWFGEYSGFASRCIMRCEDHGNWRARADAFLYNGSGCPTCAKGGFDTTKDGFLYVLEVEGRHGFTGYGISNCPDRRLSDHNRNLTKVGFRMGRTQIFQMTGQQALDVEKAVKKRFRRFAQDIEGFRTEATYAEHYQDVIDFVDEWLFNNT